MELNQIPEWVQQYCNAEGYSDPQCVGGKWWAFPPNGVMPVPLNDSQTRLHGLADIVSRLDIAAMFRQRSPYHANNLYRTHRIIASRRSSEEKSLNPSPIGDIEINFLDN